MPNQPGYVNNGAAYDTSTSPRRSPASSGRIHDGVGRLLPAELGPESGQDLTLTSLRPPVTAFGSTEQLFQAADEGDRHQDH